MSGFRCQFCKGSLTKVHYPKLYNMAHLLALNVLLLPKDLTIIFNYRYLTSPRPPPRNLRGNKFTQHLKKRKIWYLTLKDDQFMTVLNNCQRIISIKTLIKNPEKTLQCYCVGSTICSLGGSGCENELSWIPCVTSIQ